MPQQLQIAIVEDDPVHAKLVALRLEKLGHRVIGSYRSGKEALESLPGAWPHLLFMDINLGGGTDGIETSHRILAIRRVPIIFLSSLSDDQTIERVNMIPGAEYITKPFEDVDLRIAIRLALAKFQMIRQLQERDFLQTLILHHIPAGIIMSNEKGVITYMNAHALSMTHLKSFVPGILHFKEIVQIVEPSTGKRLDNPVERIRSTKKAWWIPQHAQFVGQDQPSIRVAGTISPVFDAENEFAGLLTVLFPIDHAHYLEYR